MHLATIFRVLGLFLMLFSFSMLTPLFVGLAFMQKVAYTFYISFAWTFGVGFLFWLACTRPQHEIKIREGFLMVVIFWLVTSSFAAIPFYLSSGAGLSLVDSLFEAVSGLTTTGASILSDVDMFSNQLKYYRQQLHFLGGMGIIVLAVAILPFLGVGGMQVYRAEMPGPIKENKLTPRITETAKSFWLIYLSMTIVCMVLYKLAGMQTLDAIGEAFSTIATGGFTMHKNSFAYYQSDTIESIAMFFMLMSTTNYGLHFLAIAQRSIKCYWHDHEFQYYILWLLVLVFVVLFAMESYNFGNNISVVKKLFAIISLATTTGFVSEDFSLWPFFVPVVIMLGAVIGGCSGSTGGGIKVMRFMLLRKQVQRELHRLLHPQAVVRVKVGDSILPYYVVQAIWGFVAAFIGFFVVLLLILMSQGLDLTTAFGASVAALANAGAGIGEVANGYHHITDTSKWAMMLAMIAGRLEIFTLLILFTPMFWKQ